MKRRRLFSALLVVSTVVALGAARAAEPVFVSTGPCSVDYSAARGNTGVTVAGQVAPVPDADVDIVHMNWTGTSSSLVVTFILAGLKSQPTFEGRGVAATFRLNQRTLRFGYTQNPRAGDAGFVEVGDRRSAAPVSAVYDVSRSMVMMAVSRAEIERYAGAPLRGNPAQALVGNTFWITPAGLQIYADTASPGDQVRLDIAGCDARPGTLTFVGSTTLYYGEPARFAARLRDADGRPAVSAWLTFTFQGRSTSAATSRDGVARVTMPVTSPAGAYPLVVTFGGSLSVRAATITVPTIVLPERTTISASVNKHGSSRPVTATLRTNDRVPLGGYPLRFSINGTTVATLTTDSAGRATWSGAHPGQVVRIDFAGVAGRYSPSYTTKRA